MTECNESVTFLCVGCCVEHVVLCAGECVRASSLHDVDGWEMLSLRSWVQSVQLVLPSHFRW